MKIYAKFDYYPNIALFIIHLYVNFLAYLYIYYLYTL